MSAVGELEAALADYPLLLTVDEAAGVLRISRAHAYELARRYEASDGIEGIPVLRVGSCLRVPRWTLVELLGTGRLVRLRDAVERDECVDDDRDKKVTIRRPQRRQRLRAVQQLALLPKD
jgi:hypothetical protein